jgi:hypothetical protein
MLKKYLSLSVFGLATLAPAAFATTVLAPGTTGVNNQAPDAFVMPVGLALASVSGTLNPQTTGGISGNYTENVYADANNVFCAGCLDFVITVKDTTDPSGDPIERVTSSSFAGFMVDAGVGGDGSGVTPLDVTRSTDGKVVGFEFGGSSTLTAGGSTKSLMIETNAMGYVPGVLSIQDGSSATASGFAPTAAPEPMSMSLLGGGLVGLGLFRLRRRSAKS